MSYVNLGDIANITTGKLNANQMVEGGKYPFFTCSKEIFQIDHYAFDCEAILLAGNNASGDFNVKHYKGKFNAYQRTYVITLKEDLLSYEYLLFQIEKSLEKLKKNSIGTNQNF
jgi:type I restriction enzyme S subunit